MNSLSTKLIIAFLVISLVGIMLVGVYLAFMTTNRFGEFMVDQYLEQVTALWTEYYRTNGSWQGIEKSSQIPPLLSKDLRPYAEEPGAPPGGIPPETRGRSGIVLADERGQVLIAGLGYRVGEQLPRAEIEKGIPISVDGVLVGTVITAHRSTWRVPPSTTTTLVVV